MKNNRTSQSDPLCIAEVLVPSGHGCIGITLCPGKKSGSDYGAPWDRDLSADLDVIRLWGATSIVSLIESDELELLSIQNLGEQVRSAGMDWHFLPIRDMGIPDTAFDRLWIYAGTLLRNQLRKGERVLVHCRGGLGRAGMIAGRLLVELGSAPYEAIRQVREARPGAIQTVAQESHVESSRPLDALQDARFDRELGCLLGGALGDAIGYRVEFCSKERIQAEYGPSGIRLETASGKLIVSDDTQMTLFTLEGQIEAAISGRPLIDCIRDSYLDWLWTQGVSNNKSGRSHLTGYPAMRAARAPGNTCLSALRDGGRGSPERPVNDSKGCGGVMRTAPLGFLAAGIGDADLYMAAAHVAALTHGHPDGYAPAGVMAVMVRSLIDNHDWGAAVTDGVDSLGHHPAAVGTRDLLTRVRSKLHDPSAPRTRAADFGQGWVGDEALAVGLYAAATEDKFTNCIAEAANHDGDSDSTASIAGQLFGARCGIEVLPADAVYRLDVLDPLLEAAWRWRLCRDEGRG